MHRQVITFHLNFNDYKRIKKLAFDKRSTIYEQLRKAIKMLLVKYNKTELKQ